jgi:hypothetical protein
MAVTVVTTSPAAQGSSPAVGRSIYVEGNRYKGRFNIALTGTYVTGGIAWDPGALTGWTFPLAEARFQTHVTVANILLQRYQATFDFVNKKVLIYDSVDNDEPNGDTLTGLAFDVELVSE